MSGIVNRSLRVAAGLMVITMTTCTDVPDDEGRSGVEDALDPMAVVESGTEGVWPCLVADSMIGDSVQLTYREEYVSEETEDIAGQEYVFFLIDSLWSGTLRNAEGEWGPYREMISLTLDTATNFLEFQFTDGPQSARFVGSVDCSSLSGQLTIGGAQYSLPPILRRH